jgi:glucosyl-dolichyl phosphate glucuronosyltransferase
MTLDVIVPTYNRSGLLVRLLRSLLEAEKPQGLELAVWVIDNNSSDGTRALIEELAPAFNGALHYLFEPQQGKAYALNAGILATSGELVGLLDDDERVASQWLTILVAAFETADLAFIGGPCLPVWEHEPPAWLPSAYRGVIGWVDAGPANRTYGDPEFNAMLMGGNAVLRRIVLENVGLYDTTLGARTGTGMLTSEDEEMYQRILAAGWRGLYVPDLIIYHHVSKERLTKSYHRGWCFWQAVSMALVDNRRPDPVAHLLGIPRWYFRTALKGLARWAKSLVVPGTRPDLGFSGELDFLRLIGFLYGRHIFRLKGKGRS